MNIIWMLAITAVLAGCAGKGAYTPKSVPDSPETAGAPVVLLDKDLRRTVAVDMVYHGKNPNGMFTVQANIRGRVFDEHLQIQVQTLYKNAAGQVLYSQPGSEPAWDTYPLSPHQTIFYTNQSLTDEAASAMVRIRYLARQQF